MLRDQSHTEGMRTPAPSASVACIIPAAGRSSRMGSFKPLLPWQGGTICGSVIDKAVLAGLKPVLVTGYEAAALEVAFGSRTELYLVHNPEWAKGMVGSIQVGCRAALVRWPCMQGFLVAPADMPALPIVAFTRLAQAGRARYAAGEEPAALFATRKGRLGHPVWIPVQFMEEILGLGQEGQLKAHLLTKTWEGVEIDSEGIFKDLDTPEEYQASI